MPLVRMTGDRHDVSAALHFWLRLCNTGRARGMALHGTPRGKMIWRISSYADEPPSAGMLMTDPVRKARAS